MTFIIVAEQIEYDEVRAYVASKNMQKTAIKLQENLATGIKPNLPEDSLLFNELNVPVHLRHYSLGYHHLKEPIRQHLLVFEFNDQYYYLLQDSKSYLFLELLIDGFAPLVILLCILCAFWIGRLTSMRVTTPIVQLANAIQHKQKPFPFQDEHDEIGVLARAFANHSDELEQFLQREQYFVSDASHELRTPLAIIAGAAETIVHQLPNNSHLKITAERIVRTTEEMQRQLTCLLLLSRDPHTITQAEVSFRQLIEECISRCQAWLVKKPVILTLDMPQDIILVTNAELARSVIWNLLRNACQYTNDGEVKVTMSNTTLIISDTGSGLPPSIDPLKFKRFMNETHQSGEGLGLSIVQRIVEYLGWHMMVESSENGCKFTLEMHSIV